MILLTAEQSKALRLQPQPLILDPTTRKTYVAVSSEDFERIKDLLEDLQEQAFWQKLADRGRADFLQGKRPASRSGRAKFIGLILASAGTS